MFDIDWLFDGDGGDESSSQAANSRSYGGSSSSSHSRINLLPKDGPGSLVERHHDLGLDRPAWFYADRQQSRFVGLRNQ